MDFVKSFGFNQVDNAAMLKLKIIAEVLVFNILNNVLHVTQALNVKTIKKGHFLGVLKILKDAANKCKTGGESHQAGGTVMASEYYGIDSGRYFENVDFHNTSYIDGLTRGPLHVQEAGGRARAVLTHFLSMTDAKDIIGKYKTEKKLDFKVAKDVYDLIMNSVDANLKQLLVPCSKNENALTVKVLQKALKGNKSLAYFEVVG